MQVPTHAGQICKIVRPLEDEDPDELYIVAEDPLPFGPEDTIYIVSLKELQRSINAPLIAARSLLLRMN
jgi:hypothetical protein